MNNIVKIGRTTHKLCVSLEDYCGQALHPFEGSRFYDLALHVSRVSCATQATSKGSRYPRLLSCCPPDIGPDLPPVSPPVRTICYSAFELDNNGNGCFILDDLLLADKPGRYTASIHLCGKKVGEFQIHLSDKLRIADVTTENSPYYCEDNRKPVNACLTRQGYSDCVENVNESVPARV